MNKYSAMKCEIDGVVFDSRREARRYQELKLLLRAGEIQDLELQPEYVLQPKYKKNGRTVRAIKYKADFRYYDNNRKTWIVEDVKGHKTKVYRIKKKLLEYQHPDVVITEI